MQRMVFLILILLFGALSFWVSTLLFGKSLWLHDFMRSFGIIVGGLAIFIFSIAEFKIVWRGDKRFIIADAFAPISFGFVTGILVYFFWG